VQPAASVTPVPDFFVPAEIDKRLAQGKTDGWRYAALPPDGEVCLLLIWLILYDLVILLCTSAITYY
jgi:hypothetical protein